MSSSNGSLTLCQEVELINEEGLVLRPSKVEGLWRHEFRDTILLVISIVLQLRDTVQGTGLESQGGGRCLDTGDTISLLFRNAHVGRGPVGKGTLPPRHSPGKTDLE